jgi:CotH kinase protein/Chitobiase/beta-hexosaminidase C-terminal domain/Lamin Tail Domain/PA14 domain
MFWRRRRRIAPLRRRLPGLEALETRLPLTASFMISEFLADNHDGLVDRYGNASDWIEIHNQGDTAGSLNGYYLTDKANNKTKWQFPDVTVAAGGYLVVFADSDHNDRDPTQELHTGFSLDKDGEYLGLIAPDGVTVVQQFAPTFPPQSQDVSYGPGLVVTNEDLVAQGSDAKTIVPTAANHTSYDGVWKNLNYTPDANWTSGTTGVGFGQTFNGFLVRTFQANIASNSPIGTTLDDLDETLTVIGNPAAYTSMAAGNYATVNFLNTGAASDSGHYGNNVQFPGQVSTTNYNNFATEAHALVTIPTAGDWTFGVRSNEGFLLSVGDFEMSRDGAGTGSTVDSLSTFHFDAAGVYNIDLYHFERTGDAWLELFAAPGARTSWNATNFDLVGDTANGGLAVKSDLVGSSGASISQILGTNVQNQMLGVNSTFYSRMTFNVTDPTAFDQLKLRMQYDDGFVAYLNGIEIARKNAPGAAGSAVAFNAVATANRNGDEVLTADEFDATSFLSLLVPGQNVLAVQCLNFTATDPDAFVSPELIATNVVGTGNVYFTTPTPGAANGNAFLGLVADTNFSVDRGYYNAPIQVAITTSTPGAQIYYTTNGSAPTEASGTLYTGPLTISRTTVLRAAAFKAGYVPTDVDTQSYFFVNDIVQQTFQSTENAGFPTTWGTFTGVDYGLDPDIIGNFDANGNPIGGDKFGGIYAAQIKASLLSLPTISLVLNTSDMFGPNGIYSNPTQRGDDWEKPVSVEYITNDGSPEFQVNAGIQIQGAFFRANSASQKHSFRLVFKNIYGPGKLDFPLFGDGATDEFNTVVLRAGANDGYSWNAAQFTEQYLRDEFGRDLQAASGNVNAHGDFVQLYINGVYWGLYNPVERPDEDFAATYFGGTPDQYDVVHRGGGSFEVQNGTLDAWTAMLAKSAQAGSSLSAYMALQGKNIDGTPNPATPALLDVDSYIRYIAINAWGGNWDWPRNNFFASRNTDPATTTGFEFFGWDIENTMGNNLSRSPLTADVFDPSTLPGSDFTGSDNAGQPHTSLVPNPEYRIDFADQVQKMFFNGGILTPASLIARYQVLANDVQSAIVGESARWGDMHYPTQPLTPANWVTERDWILNTYLPQRTAIVLAEFRKYGLYPSVDAPTLNQFGGNFAGGFRLSIGSTNSGGTIYYTLDGSDPRQIGGALSTTAKTYFNPIELSGNATVMARYRSASGEWSALVEALFTQTSVGAVRGDFNRDGVRSAADIMPMMQALADANAFQTANALSIANVLTIGDINGDGVFNNADLQSFLTELRGGGGSEAPAEALNQVPTGASISSDDLGSDSSALTARAATADNSGRLPDVILATADRALALPTAYGNHHNMTGDYTNASTSESLRLVQPRKQLSEVRGIDSAFSHVQHHRSRFNPDGFDADLTDEAISSFSNPG